MDESQNYIVFWILISGTVLFSYFKTENNFKLRFNFKSSLCIFIFIALKSANPIFFFFRKSNILAWAIKCKSLKDLHIITYSLEISPYLPLILYTHCKISQKKNIYFFTLLFLSSIAKDVHLKYTYFLSVLFLYK